MTDTTPPNDGIEHLTARPAAGVTTLAAGSYSFGVAGANNCCVLRIPQTTKSALPLLVMLHGAGGTPEAVDEILTLGDDFGYAVLAPKSAGRTWDVALTGFGVDVTMLNAALMETFKRVNVDTKHVAIAGFSDGASYALSLGLANGDLFSHVIAFSPGFMTPVPRTGTPLFMLIHGSLDGATSARVTRDTFVPFLRTLGYTVRYDEFAGGHVVDDTEARAASSWFLTS